MIISKKVLDEKIDEIGNKPWHPIEVVSVNDQVVRMAMCRGEYHWHKHTNEDELFLVLKGKLIIQLKPPKSNITLNEKELVVIPKNVEHCPKSAEPSYNLLFEPYILQTRGD